MASIKITTRDQWDQRDKNGNSLLFFWASWHELSKEGSQLHDIFSALAAKYSNMQCYLVEAEALPSISEIFQISVVPTFVGCQGDKIIARLEGVNPAELSTLAKTISNLKVDEPEIIDTKAALNARISSLIGTAPVMLFMKGTPSAPRCGFSRTIVGILNDNNIPFASFDILGDEEVRAGLKEFSEWPTYPQLYVNNTFVGGLDIIKELAATGDLKTQLGLENFILPPPPQTLEDRLRGLINSSTVMLFMKGVPEEPRCGFSRTIVAILKEEGIEFASFDILTDEEVRSGLKTFSDWPTYPQLYVKGSLVGGLDIVKEMKATGSLREQLELA